MKKKLILSVLFIICLNLYGEEITPILKNQNTLQFYESEIHLNIEQEYELYNLFSSNIQNWESVKFSDIDPRYLDCKGTTIVAKKEGNSSIKVIYGNEQYKIKIKITKNYFKLFCNWLLKWSAFIVAIATIIIDQVAEHKKHKAEILESRKNLILNNSLNEIELIYSTGKEFYNLVMDICINLIKLDDSKHSESFSNNCCEMVSSSRRLRMYYSIYRNNYEINKDEYSNIFNEIVDFHLSLIDKVEKTTELVNNSVQFDVDDYLDDIDSWLKTNTTKLENMLIDFSQKI